MRSSRTRKVFIVVGAFVLAMVGSIAFAYWTSDGSGTGYADTGDTRPVVIEQTSVVSDLRPGGAPQTLSGRFDNPNAGPVFIGTVTASIDGVTTAAGAVGECTADDYVLSGAEMTVNSEIAAGDDVGTWSGARLAFHNKATVDQDGCKGATVTLAYTAR